MPKEELLFLWKISLALLGFGSGRRPVKFEGDKFDLAPTSVSDEKNPGDTDLTPLVRGNLFGAANVLPQSLATTRVSDTSIGDACGGGVEKCMVLVTGPDSSWGVAGLQNEVAFKVLIPDFAAAC